MPSPQKKTTWAKIFAEKGIVKYTLHNLKYITSKKGNKNRCDLSKLYKVDGKHYNY